MSNVTWSSRLPRLSQRILPGQFHSLSSSRYMAHFPPIFPHICLNQFKKLRFIISTPPRLPASAFQELNTSRILSFVFLSSWMQTLLTNRFWILVNFLQVTLMDSFLSKHSLSFASFQCSYRKYHNKPRSDVQLHLAYMRYTTLFCCFFDMSVTILTVGVCVHVFFLTTS